MKSPTKTVLNLLLALALVPHASTTPQRNAPKTAQARDILRQAYTLLKDFPEDSRPGAAAKLAHLQGRAGDSSGALETASSLANPTDYTEALRNISWGLAQRGDTAAAVHVLESAPASQLRAGWYSNVAIILAGRGDIAGARRLLPLTNEALDSHAAVLTSIARAQKNAGDAAAAAKTLHEALLIADQEHAETPDAGVSDEPEILADIAQAQDALGDHPASLLTLARLGRLVEQAQPGSRDELLKLFARAQANVGEAAAAEQTANQIPINAATGNGPIPVGQSREYNLSLVAQLVARHGDVRGARGVAAGIALPQWQSYAYGDIAEAQADAGDLAGAQETIALIPDAASRIFSLARIAEDLAHHSSPAAEGMLQIATSAAAATPGEDPQAVLPNLAMARADTGDINGAQAIIAGLQEEHSKFLPQLHLLQAMAQAGDVPGALALAQNQSFPTNKFEMLIRVATGILDAVDAQNKKQSGNPALR